MALVRRPLEAAGRYRPWLAASAAATAAAAALGLGGSTAYERVLGTLPPVLAVAGAGIVGLGALASLEARGYWRRPGRARTVRGLVVATAGCLPFAALAIGADVLAGYPRDTNAAWPDAWLYYPSIAVVAESMLHLLPLAALAWLTGYRSAGHGFDRPTVALALAVAAVEPAVQVMLGTALPGFTLLHVYAIGVFELLLLRRYGYLPMLWFRVSYYLLWHVLWGAARLPLLFGDA
jgi:hypothetical protein